MKRTPTTEDRAIYERRQFDFVATSMIADDHFANRKTNAHLPFWATPDYTVADMVKQRILNFATLDVLDNAESIY